MYLEVGETSFNACLVLDGWFEWWTHRQERCLGADGWTERGTSGDTWLLRGKEIEH